MRTLQPHELFIVGDPANRYTSMIRTLQTLYNTPPRPHYVAIACLLTCYLDAVAARGGESTPAKYRQFLRNNFEQLCSGLDGQEKGKDGAAVFYKYYRSEMVHTFFSRNPKYAIAEHRELDGAYVGPVFVQGRSEPYTAINIDRLYKDFVSLAKRKAKQKRL